jgi:hypothetical protein
MRNTEPVLVTREYIMKHRTKRGAWTRVQILALGIEWPPQQGWIDEVCGQTLSPESAIEFETGKEIAAKKDKAKSKPRIDDCIDCIFDSQESLNHHHLAKLAQILGNAKKRGK